jgi:hypothetical protein
MELALRLRTQGSYPRAPAELLVKIRCEQYPLKNVANNSAPNIDRLATRSG